mmetsp:Transcript_3747/g.5808  ORF Transcript_3747/g.5808 Transcript_3747/m.5808 type:complete len:359 (+) Transcript_3747:77-1153(+)
MSSEDQLVSFFSYSVFVYPVAGYLVSPQRPYKRWKGIVLAVLFLSAISSVQLYIENQEKGPNYYQLLNVSRENSYASIKKAYKRVSLELHPDKNKSPTAAGQFSAASHAYNVLLNPELRNVYDRLGENGLRVLAQHPIDLEYLLVNTLVLYVSSAVMAFIMTVSDSSGRAFEASMLGLGVMLLVECILVVKGVPLPAWFLSTWTTHDLVSTLHRLFPAYMHGCRCILNSAYISPAWIRYEAFRAVHEGQNIVSKEVLKLARTVQRRLVRASVTATKPDGVSQIVSPSPTEGVVLTALGHVVNKMKGEKCEGVAAVREKLKLLGDEYVSNDRSCSSSWLSSVKYLFLYLVIWLVVRRLK